MNISVVIPTLNEVTHLADAVQSARRAGLEEIVVADGGSRDGTRELARSLGCDVVFSVPGRGPQQNAGAARTGGDLLLFLHADARLPANARVQIESACRAEDRILGGGFRQEITHPARPYRWLEHGNAARVRLQQLVYGDQGLFVRRESFEAVGGFPEIPLMEDFELSRQLRRRGKLVLLPGPIETSPRRWEQHGILRQTVRNWTLCGLYRCGVSPSRLARIYNRRDRSPADRG